MTTKTKTKTKTPEKKQATTEATPATRSTHVPDLFGASSVADWFDRWPEIFARRWPESFRQAPFFDEPIPIEHFREDDGTLVVRAELPGIDPDEDVEVTIDDGRLTIAAHREERSEEHESGTYRSEFRYGSSQRTMPLPAGSRADDVAASYDDGILEIRVPVDGDPPSATKVDIKRQR